MSRFTRQAIYFLWLLPTSAVAASQMSVTYVCVEERSVGWEAREGSEDAVGRFRTSESPIIVTWNAQGWREFYPGKRFLQLSNIVVSENGKKYTHETANCDYIYHAPILFPDDDMSRPARDEKCDEYLRSGEFEREVYGGNVGNQFRFSQQLRERPQSMSYIHTRTLYFHIASLSRGRCTLID